MMINKRLIALVPECKRWVALAVVLQWLALVANIAMMWQIALLMQEIYQGRAQAGRFAAAGAVALGAIALRILSARGTAYLSQRSGQAVKKTVRRLIYEKLLRLGGGYQRQVATSEAVQLAVEGVDQLETYFGAYLPQFFYAMLAPVTLCLALCRISVVTAVALFLCVPLIPVSIAAVQTWAKKLLGKYWGEYTALGDTFLENLQGLTTLKIYQADEFKQREMDREAERFRRITMRVLTMQLNSTTIMDIIAYGGAALGVILSVSGFAQGKMTLAGCLAIILLAADFFLPMRVLGSYFHISMNGMAASDKIFRLLDLPEPCRTGKVPVPGCGDIRCQGLRYSYEPEREILRGIDLTLPQGGFTAIVGESGCGKSTIAGILMGRDSGYEGSVTLGGVELRDCREDSLMAHVTYVGHNSYLFKGTVRDNLRMGKPDASEEELWRVLERTRLSGFVREGGGLDMPVAERGENLSGGQRQRLALARALLHDSPVYLFDEATSNIDVESENDIMEQILALAETRTVLLISHRLANVVPADRIYVLEGGVVAESGGHRELLERKGVYARLWNVQQELERFGKEAVGA